MATITISLSGSAIVNGSKNYTISDPDLQRLLNAISSSYNITGTNGQILLAYAQFLRDQTVSIIKGQETSTIAKQAQTNIAAVAPIAMS